MKLYEVRTEIINGDGFSDYFYSLTDAKKKAEYILNHLTESEKGNREITIVGYELSLENYTRTAEQLVNDLFSGDVECDEAAERRFYFLHKNKRPSASASDLSLAMTIYGRFV